MGLGKIRGQIKGMFPDKGQMILKFYLGENGTKPLERRNVIGERTDFDRADDPVLPSLDQPSVSNFPHLRNSDAVNTRPVTIRGDIPGIQVTFSKKNDSVVAPLSATSQPNLQFLNRFPCLFIAENWESVFQNLSVC
ncbi:MAG: hypothetical protein V1719_01050 [Patescibacteria group bacterium]